MNTNILKAAILLFVGVLVNSHPTDKPVGVPRHYKHTKLMPYLIKDGNFPYFGSKYVNTQIQVALSAWKQGDRIPKGTYYAYLVNNDRYFPETDFKLKLAEIEYNGTEHNNWVRIPLEWINIPTEHANKMTVFLKASNISTNETAFLNSSAKNWTYTVFFKTKDASDEGIREDENNFENPTTEFCTQSIITMGANKTLGAVCPVDPIDLNNLKPMDRCLNWRRIDRVGKKCREIISLETMEKSMDVFCAKDHWLADCRCINRRFYKEYQEQRLTETLPGFYWYVPCRLGTYLVKEKEKV